MMLRSFACLLAALSICCIPAGAQKSGAPGASQASDSQAGAGGSETSSPAVGFSIESEMFTYKAVEQNSEIIACDVARFLFGGQLVEAPEGASAPCAIVNAAQTSPGVVLLSSNSSILSDLRVWRGDMAMMSVLEARAASVCVECRNADGTPCATQGLSGRPAEGGVTARGLTPSAVGTGSSLISAALGMLSHNESASPVSGTVQDNALLNEVARQLRSLNVQVLIPEIYSPTGSDNDFADSAYIKKLEALSAAEGMCSKSLASYPRDANTSAITALTDDIQNFEKALTALPPAANGANGQAGTSPVGPSHLSLALAADQVAQRLFPGEVGNGSNQWQYVLWLQALESGGSVLHQSSFLGTKLSFSGGAVDTYAIFRADGELACSGNVFDFQKPTRTKDLDKSYGAKSKLDPAHPPFSRSTCANLPPMQSSASGQQNK